MKKAVLSIIIMMTYSAAVLPQGQGQSAQGAKPTAETKVPVQKASDKADKSKEDPFPSQAVLSDSITVTMPSFNKRADLRGQGEVLETQFSITINGDNKLDMYVFVIATHEETKWITNSFGTKKVYPERVDISEFSPFPGKKENFEHDINGVKKLTKYPKDYKLGANPQTGKPYTVTDRLNIRTDHIVLYKKKFQFFNNVTVLIYDDEGKVMYRQMYALKGMRTH